MKPVLRYGLAVVALSVIAVLGVFFVGNRPVAVVVADTEENVLIRVFGLGSVEARVLSRIGFEVGATLSELTADHGERVARGQVLARLDPGEQSAKVAKARAALSIAEVGIARSAANQEKGLAVLAQRELVATRRLALIGREVVTQQAL
ncbi:MAG: biotin/lipoyl-binding protein, partial [Beijerinckiaceae bacterium]